MLDSTMQCRSHRHGAVGTRTFLQEPKLIPGIHALDAMAVLGYAGDTVGDESNRVVVESATDALAIDPVELAPIVLSVIEFDDFMLVAEPPLAIEVRLDDLDDEEQRSLALDIVELGIFVSGSTREDLIDELHEHLEVAWAEYAEAEDSELSQDARDIKRALFSRFQKHLRSNEGK